MGSGLRAPGKAAKAAECWLDCTFVDRSGGRPVRAGDAAAAKHGPPDRAGKQGVEKISTN